MHKVFAGACWGFVIAYALALPGTIGMLCVLTMIGAGFMIIRRPA